MEDWKIFTDAKLENEVGETLDLGRVNVGDTKQFTYYLYNSSRSPYENIELLINREEVKVIEAPTKLAEKMSAKIILEWTPLVSTKLQVKPILKINGYRLESL